MERGERRDAPRDAAARSHTSGILADLPWHHGACRRAVDLDADAPVRVGHAPVAARHRGGRYLRIVCRLAPISLRPWVSAKRVPRARLPPIRGIRTGGGLLIGARTAAPARLARPRSTFASRPQALEQHRVKRVHTASACPSRRRRQQPKLQVRRARGRSSLPPSQRLASSVSRRSPVTAGTEQRSVTQSLKAQPSPMAPRRDRHPARVGRAEAPPDHDTMPSRKI